MGFGSSADVKVDVETEAGAGAATKIGAVAKTGIANRTGAEIEGVDGRLTVLIDGIAVPAQCTYDAGTLSLTVEVPPVGRRSSIEIVIRSAQLAEDPILDDVFTMLNDAQMEYFTKECAYAAIRRSGRAALASMHSFEADAGEYGEPEWFMSHMPQSVINVLAEVLNRSR